jgi:hypothetical protein
MAVHQFWKFSGPESTRTLAEWDPSLMKVESIACPVNEGHRRAGARTTPMTVVLPSIEIADFVWTWYGDCLLTEKARETFRNAGLSGYKLELAAISSVKRKKGGDPALPTLWDLVTTSRARTAAEAGLYVKRSCAACGWVQYSAYEHGLPVDETTWDGSDFFHLIEWGGFFVTDRVRDCVLKDRLTGAVFTKAEELHWPEGVAKP